MPLDLLELALICAMYKNNIAAIKIGLKSYGYAKGFTKFFPSPIFLINTTIFFSFFLEKKNKNIIILINFSSSTLSIQNTPKQPPKKKKKKLCTTTFFLINGHPH